MIDPLPLSILFERHHYSGEINLVEAEGSLIWEIAHNEYVDTDSVDRLLRLVRERISIEALERLRQACHTTLEELPGGDMSSDRVLNVHLILRSVVLIMKQGSSVVVSA